MKTLLDYVTHYLQDGKPRKLVHIATAVKSMGWEAGISYQYIGVYQLLKSHPEMFRRTDAGTYQMVVDTTGNSSKDLDQIKELIFGILKKKSKQTAAQVWSALKDEGIVITYSLVQYLLQSDMFTKDQFSRFSNKK